MLKAQIADAQQNARSQYTTCTTPPSVATLSAMRTLWDTAKDADVNGFCRMRLALLESRFDSYCLENRDQELELSVSSAAKQADVLSVPKVDTHIHSSAMMTARQLSTFMHDKFKVDEDREYKGTTVGKAMREAGFSPAATSIDGLAGNHKMFDNFAVFNAGFTPLGSRELKSLFLGRVG